MLFEPTETETKETIDAFTEIMRELLAEAEGDPEIARNAPYTAPVRRLDEAGAARRPVVRQPREAGHTVPGDSEHPESVTHGSV